MYFLFTKDYFYLLNFIFIHLIFIHLSLYSYLMQILTNPTPILSSNGIHKLHHQFYIPDGDIIATLLIVHGMSEHSERYDQFARVLANHGVLVATYDQLGHGKTVKDKYELGFFDKKYPVQTLCKDVIIVADALKKQAILYHAKHYANIPHFIMGHSMGSFLVRTVLIHHSTSFDGTILMGTAHAARWFNKALTIALVIFNRYYPKQRNQKLAYLMNAYLLNKISAPISASPFAWLSENTANIQAFENDPLCGFVFSNNGFYTLHALITQALMPNWYQYMPSDYPILLISGKDDPVGNMGQDIIDLHDELINANKNSQKILYVNMRHEPLQECNNHQVFADILGWIKRCV